MSQRERERREPNHVIVYSVDFPVDGRTSSFKAGMRIMDKDPTPSEARRILALIEQNKVAPHQYLKIEGARLEGGVPRVPNPSYESFMERVRKMAQVNKPKEFPPL